MKLSALALVLLALFSSLVPSPAFAKARLGFGVAVATEGFLSTTLAEVKVASVQAGSPSEKAGLRKGDLIVELNGKPIKGASGLALKKTLAAVQGGDHVVLKVQRAGTGPVLIDIVAGH
ncbi:PDZ domain-containing protein [Lysobacter koreensis]|uniref:PDZ domain-containing protein n=1 Tax=Lysobacter koreensis TaxID=266122 RepID=A0ABW2YRT6_9GAMM